MPAPHKKPRCARKIAFPADSVTRSVDAPTPGPSGEQLRRKSLADDLKAVRSSKVQNVKNRAKLSPDQRQLLADLRERKQVGHFLLPDAPVSKKGKGKRTDSQIWMPCPLLPGVPAVVPPRKPQPWEVLRCHETTPEAGAAGQSEDTFVPSPVMERTVESDDEVIEDTPPEIRERRHLVAASKDRKRCQIDFSDSIEVVQAENSPLNPVWADIEFIGFTPQSSTSRTAPESGGMSTMSYEIDVDIECELPELHDSGSEIDVDNNLEDNLWRSRNAEFDDLDDPTFAEDIQHIDAEADVALQAIADPEDGNLLFFDWCGDINNFEGVREIFTGPSGPTFEVAGLTPLEVFEKIWDADIIDHIVRETNLYAHQQLKLTSKNSRMSRWRDTTREEIWRFFTILMLQSLVVNNVEREYWYPSFEQLRIGVFGQIMPFNRFVLLKRCLHFVDNTSLPKNPSKLDKVMPIIKHLNKKFSSLYLPEQNVTIDESLLLWKGRLSFAQLIVTKRAKVGIKSYELCESRTGYLWKMEVYSGKGHVHAPQEAPQEVIEGHEVENEPESATSQIVFNLMRPLFGKGHTLVMDNFYNAPLLSRLLKLKHTDSMGTLRLNREYVPETLKYKNKKNMNLGEVCFSSTKDLSVMVWRDNNNVVPMLSTFHQLKVAGKEKYGYYKYKPKVVLDYNVSMGGVDHKDQMLHSYPIERVRNICWYKKLFRRLLNVSVHNAFVIYDHDCTKKTRLGNRDFRLQLVRDMLQIYSHQALTSSTRLESPVTLSQLHLPSKNQKKQRCKLCYIAKVQRTTVWRCSTCQVSLCIEGCYTAYHAQYVYK